ncbi:Ser-Thr-rich glycosyl-phosphatidyl-inositol-anchored membrane family-domain-containing protein [Hysterangium stoloniferum]|nr:Ser-Thr-rich glycosyl-phosphatidyl-inositol-anchored membrane family-domain-containing protein [Hysterangium stoloniferum]
MAVFSFVALLFLAASSIAITVTSPSQGTTWTSSGPNTVTWFEVDTDPTSFAITLVNQPFPNQLLADNVDGTKKSLTVTASLPVGSTYQVNIVKSSQDINAILAQSAQFNISGGGGVSTISHSSFATSNRPSFSLPTSVSSGLTATSGSVSALNGPITSGSSSTPGSG